MWDEEDSFLNRGIYFLIHKSNPWQRRVLPGYFLLGLKNSSLPAGQWKAHFKGVQHNTV